MCFLTSTVYGYIVTRTITKSDLMNDLHIFIHVYTVEHLLTDPPRSGQPPSSGQALNHHLILPFI